MGNPRIVHMITPLKHMSPFDVNMALDAGFDAAIPYTHVPIEDVAGLVQDAIFSRGPEGVKRTGMFIGGKRAIEALDMMDRAKKAMVPPFEISVFADPAGSFTTAAAMVACVKKALRDNFSTELKGKRVAVFGGTGVVGFALAVVAGPGGKTTADARPAETGQAPQGRDRRECGAASGGGRRRRERQRQASAGNR